MKVSLLAGLLFGLTGFVPFPWAAESSASAAWQRLSAQSTAALNSDAARPTASTPGDIPTLQFSEFFGPIGDRGLDYSESLLALAGKRVRLSGHMVREQNRSPGVFLFTARPARVEQSGYCYFEDLPTAMAHVVVPGASAVRVPYQPGRMELIGTLEIGPRIEADGRNSAVRLVLDSDAAAMLLGESFTDSSSVAVPPSPSATHQLP